MRPPNEPPPKTDFAINHMRVLVEEITERVQKVLTAEGYFAPRPAHVNLMAHVPIEGVRPTELAARMQVSKQAVDQLLDQLEAGGAVSREVDPRDGRGRLVRPTPWAMEAYLRAGSILGEVEEEWRRRMGEPAFRAFEAALEVIRERGAPASPARMD